MHATESTALEQTPDVCGSFPRLNEGQIATLMSAEWERRVWGHRPSTVDAMRTVPQARRRSGREQA